MNMRISAGELTERSLQIIRDLKHLEGPMLPILHAIQAEFGYVPEEVKPVIASELNLSRAEVHGVVTFYHEFRDHPAGRHVLKLCRAEACQSMGGDRLAERAKALLGIDFHETTPDGAVTLEPVYCLGLCSCSPSAMLDGEVHARLDETVLEALVAEARR
jgi:formate dehydrogenase subunit gamma